MFHVIVGDTHANKNRVHNIIERAHTMGISTIIQVGDFGWWPQIGWGKHFIHWTNESLAKRDMTLYWLAGNHENHDTLIAAQESDVPWPVRSNIMFLPHGWHGEIDGVHYAVMGGAYSIDKDRRTEGYDWFPREIPTWEQVNRAFDTFPSKVDVLLTHDAPERTFMGADVDPDLWGHHHPDNDPYPTSRYVRRLMQEIHDHCHPTVHFHGHHHYRHTTPLGDSVVEGLGHDHDPILEQCVILNTDTLEVGSFLESEVERMTAQSSGSTGNGPVT